MLCELVCPIKKLNILDTYNATFRLLSKKRKQQFLMAVILSSLSAFSEFLSITGLVPLIAIIIGDEKSSKNLQIFELFKIFGIEDDKTISIIVILSFVSLVIISSIFRILTIYFNGRLAAAIGTDMASIILRNSLYQSLKVHMKTNSSLIVTTLSQYINITVGFLRNLLQFFSSVLICFALINGFFVINFKIALTITIFFGLIYLGIINFNRKKIAERSSFMSKGENKKTKIVIEALGSIRDLLLSNNQKYFLNQFISIDKPLRIKREEIFFIGIFPRFLIEGIALTSISFLFLGILITDRNAVFILPLLAAIGLGFQKLLPALQQVFNNWSNMKAILSQVNQVLDLANVSIDEYDLVSSSLKKYLIQNKNIGFSKSIELKNICFKYENIDKPILNRVKLHIKKGECIGLMGETGSGKSTLIDIIMSLLEPYDGDLLVDGIKISKEENLENVIKWRQSISLVPQSIFLTDNSIYENIAFGISKKDIDFKRVLEVCKVAQIDKFIESLELGYETQVGENAIRLSGGQAQRIGIARALYRKSAVLVLDEATSALDIKTEKKLMQSIFGYLKNVTVIMIAHRISTLKNANKILELKEGFLYQHNSDFLNNLPK